MEVDLSVRDRDVANAESVRDILKLKNEEHATSVALSLTAFLAAAFAEGKDIVLHSPDGSLQRVAMAEFDAIRETGG